MFFLTNCSLNAQIVRASGTLSPLSVYADHLALRAVTHDGGYPLREARQERSGARF